MIPERKAHQQNEVVSAVEMRVVSRRLPWTESSEMSCMSSGIIAAKVSTIISGPYSSGDIFPGDTMAPLVVP